jgi:outer membrane protein assembly factor BamB
MYAHLRILMLLLLGILPGLGLCVENDWPAWRGPHGDGSSEDGEVPLHWSKTENIRWKMSVPGKGHSSPIVVGDRIFLTAYLESSQDRLLLCFSRTDGKLLWQQTVLTAPSEEMHRNNTPASSTPVSDGKRVWVSFLDGKEMVVAGYTLDGKPTWKRSVGPYDSKHGFCSTLAMYRDSLICNGDSDGEAFLAAVDPTTGKDLWRVPRPNRVRSFSVPLFIEANAKKQLILAGSKSVASYDPESGKQKWVVESSTDKFVATAIYSDGLVIATGTSPSTNTFAIRPDGEGNVTDTNVVWHNTKLGAYVPSPVDLGKTFFLVTDSGIAHLMESKTGKVIYKERLGTHHDASPLRIGKHLFCLDDRGTMWILKTGNEFEVVSKNALDEECHATPAVSRGELFVRTTQHLICIGKSSKQ